MGKRIRALRASLRQHPGQRLFVAVYGCAGNDAVVVIRKAQRFHERRAATVRAAFQIGVIHFATIERRDDSLGQRGRQVICTKRVVEQCFRILHELEILILVGVSGIRGRHRETTWEQAYRVVQITGHATGCAEHEPAVPTLTRQRDLEADRSVDDTTYPAMLWQRFGGCDEHTWLYPVIEIRKSIEISAGALCATGGKGLHCRCAKYRRQRPETQRGKTTQRWTLVGGYDVDQRVEYFVRALAQHGVATAGEPENLGIGQVRRDIETRPGGRHKIFVAGDD